ncbi:MAG TPA: HAD family acid phosphatase [Opitutaceae bacterium]|nr:HAD family acid phosphatase [Opitutaceae bacterium]
MKVRTVIAHAVFALLAASLPAAPENLGLLKERVRAYLDSEAYFAEIEPVALEAVAFIADRAAARAEGERLAVVLDIDETALSNYPHIREMDFAYKDDLWDAWVLEARCPPVAPVLEIHRTARANSVAVFFLSGRKELTRKATARNLLGTGFSGFEALILKEDDSTEPTSVFKARERARLAAEGWTIIACVGDQESDLAGEHTGRTFKIPNPAYFIP